MKEGLVEKVTELVFPLKTREPPILWVKKNVHDDSANISRDGSWLLES